jgi:hypothetical protein
MDTSSEWVDDNAIRLVVDTLVSHLHPMTSISLLLWGRYLRLGEPKWRRLLLRGLQAFPARKEEQSKTVCLQLLTSNE